MINLICLFFICEVFCLCCVLSVQCFICTLFYLYIVLSVQCFICTVFYLYSVLFVQCFISVVFYLCSVLAVQCFICAVFHIADDCIVYQITTFDYWNKKYCFSSLRFYVFNKLALQADNGYSKLFIE